eukprot:3976561-Ditylum_brightwellii.AAC.2
MMGGKGRALAAWDCYRAGIDPLLYFDTSIPDSVLDESVFTAKSLQNENDDTTASTTTTRTDMAKSLPPKRFTQGLGDVALKQLKSISYENGGIEDKIAKLTHIDTSSDGTTKLLIQMVSDGLEVETVIIPWEERGRSTLCLS